MAAGACPGWHFCFSLISWAMRWAATSIGADTVSVRVRDSAHGRPHSLASKETRSCRRGRIETLTVGGADD